MPKSHGKQQRRNMSLEPKLVMLSPREQAGLEAKMLSSTLSICPRHVLELPQRFVLV